ncbi:MAG: sulfatase [Planctomycetes bacterium]|nr:sulfatase [Planctomycetota bacterium]
MRTRLLPCALLSVLLLQACSDPVTKSRFADAADWDVLVVVLDALPANHLGLYGYQPNGYPSPPISPEIAAFASGLGRHETLVFDEAHASASYTLASTASLFTGASPATHGVLGLATNVLAKEHVTLAETLRSAGFATGALSSNPNVSIEGQFDQGFDTFRHYFRDEFDLHTLPAHFVEDAGTWWRSEGAQRRFLYAHLLPPHQPYDPPPPHSDLFGAGSVERAEGLTPYLTELDRRTDLTADSPEVERVRRRFDAGVHYADALFGELLANLGGPNGEGLANTLIVLTSDHGEAFAQHGLLLHGGGVYEELTRVPLVFGFPNGSLPETSQRTASLVSTTDLAATLCEILDLPWPGLAKGTSFLEPALAGESTERPVLSRSAGDRPLWSLRTDHFTFIEHGATGTRQLFDRRTDPGELQDLAPSDPERTQKLAAKLESELEAARRAGATFPRGSVPALIHKDALEALGYFGD